MSSVTNYKIYCNTEERYVEGYGTAPPNSCYNNNTHDVNHNSVKLIKTISENAVRIIEEDIPTGTHYGCTAFRFDAAPLSTTVYQSSFPVPVSMLTAQLQVSNDMVNDTLDFAFAPNMPVGKLTEPCLAGDTVLNVSPTVVEFLYLGLYIKIHSGDNVSDCGRVTSIDKVNFQITVETPTQHAHDTDSGVLATRFFIKDYFIVTPGIHKIGFCKTGGGHTPANTPGNCIYVNTSDQVKKVCFAIEYYF